MAEVNLDIIVEVDKALKDIKSFGKQSANSLESVEKSFGAIKAVGATILAAMALDKIVSGIGTMVDAAAEADREFKKMSSALKLAGDFSERNAAQFKRLAEGLQETTKFDDDLILGQVAIAKQFGATNQEAEKLIRAAVDLAAATGMELPQATELLGRSLDGTAGRLNEVVPGMRSLTAAQLAAGGAIDLVAKRFAGAANSELNTFSGATTRLKNVMSGLVEEFGDVIVNNDVVIQAFNGMIKVIKVIGDVFIENKSAIRDFVSGGVIFAAQAFGVFVQMIRIVDETLSKISVGLSTTAKILAINGESAKKAGGFFKALKGAVLDAGKSMDSFDRRNETYDKITEAVANLSVELESVDKTQKSVTSSVKETSEGFDKLTPKFGRVNAEALAAFGKLKDELNAFGAKQSDILQKKFEREKQLIQQSGAAEQEKISYLAKLQERYDVERSSALKKEREERFAEEQKFISELAQISQNPIKIFFDKQSLNSLNLGEDVRKGMSAGIGALTAMLQGKEGARRLMSNAAEAVGQAFLGVPGFGQVFELLSQGPDQVKAMISSFLDAIPELIVNVAEAIPAVVEALANKLSDPDFISRVATALAKAALTTGPAFAAAMIKGAGQFMSTILNGAVHFVQEILKGAGRFIEELVKGIGDAIGGALESLNPLQIGGSGGKSIIPGVNIIPDSIPVLGGLFKAGMDDGSLRMNGNRSLASKSASSSGGASADTSSSGPQSLTVVVQVERQALAKTILDLNKLGYRLA